MCNNMLLQLKNVEAETCLVAFNLQFHQFANLSMDGFSEKIALNLELELQQQFKLSSHFLILPQCFNLICVPMNVMLHALFSVVNYNCLRKKWI